MVVDMLRRVLSFAIPITWIAVACLAFREAQVGVIAASFLLLLWVVSVAPQRPVPSIVRPLLASGSVLVLAALLFVTGIDTATVLSLLLVSIGATITISSDRFAASSQNSQDGVSVAEEHLESIDDGMETRDWSGMEVDDASLDSGMVGPLETQCSDELVRRAQKSRAFTESEIVALETGLRKSNSPVRTLKKMIAADELTKFQAMHLLWGQESQLRFGDYSLIEVLGRGASSTVYRARDAASGNALAIKILHADAHSLKRVHREMQSVRKLAHPNIVMAYECGKIHTRFYIAMELVEGSDLNQVVRDHGPLGERDALVSVLQIALALQHAHDRGILHRDVKPGNMLLTPSGDVKLADLGLSCPMQRAGDCGSFETAKNSLGGTLEFMAPEQVSDFRNVDTRADTFALGSSLFFLLTGRSRLPGKSLADRINNLTVHRKFLKTSDHIENPSISSLIDRLSAFDVEDRIATTGEALEAIRIATAQLGRPHHQSIVRVLIVEDNRDDMYLTLAMLAKSNRAIETYEAACLKDGLSACRSERNGQSGCLFDILLLDANLPDSEGEETIRRFREACSNSAIVVLSDQDDDDFRSLCMSEGADSFLTKADLKAESLEREIFVTLARRRASPSQRGLVSAK